MEIGNWVKDVPTGYVFKIEKIWGDCVLCDDYIDSGDVYLITDLIMATKEEIKQEINRRKKINQKSEH